MTGQPSPARTSHEKAYIDRVEAALRPLFPNATYHRGQGAANRVGVHAWALTPLQQFQFGDLRTETAYADAVVEVESAGGLTNLVKYWPYLADHPPRRLVLAHVFRLTSPNDYIAHRNLWTFVLDRMRRDLNGAHGVRWPEDWEAQMFTYDATAETDSVVDFLRRGIEAAKAPRSSG